jgi:antitoxin (DNA-binding transcriptional repressor) of toxin-antitoxin stability system
MRKQLKKYGMRQAKAHLSEIARDAAAGVCTIITDNRNPVAMVGPLPADETETETARQPKRWRSAQRRQERVTTPGGNALFLSG